MTAETASVGDAFLFTGCALVFALLEHLLFRYAESLERHRKIITRDWVVLPGIIALVCLAGAWLDWLDNTRPDLVAGMGLAFLFGLAIGQTMPRPPRRPRDRS